MKKSTKTFVISDETPNLFGFVTKTDGIDLSDFFENPVLLFNHDYNKVIGQWTDVRVESGKLLGVPMFDESDPEAMLLYGKVEQGILKACSAGLTPIQFDEQKNILVKSSLKEGTLTPVGANRKAITLSLYDTKGKSLSGTDVKEFLLSLQPTQADKPQNQTMKQSLINAMVVLCAAAGQTVALSATEDEFEAGLKAAGVRLSALTNQVNSLELSAKLLAGKELDDLLTNAVTEKLLSAAQVPAFRALGEMNIEQLKVTLSAMKPAITKPVEQQRTITTTTIDPNDPTAKWTYDEFALNAPDELKKMQVNDKARFELLLSAKVKSARTKYSIAADDEPDMNI